MMNSSWQKESLWEAQRWEFYRDTQGLWRWRATAVPKEKCEGHLSGKLQQNYQWVEIATSMKGYKLKNDCEMNAKQYMTKKF